MRGTNCPECGPDVGIDLEGRCVKCGRDALDPKLPFDDEVSGYVGPGAYHSGVATSKITAEMVLPKISARERRVWEWIHQRGHYGATIDETSETLDLLVASVCPCFYHLRKLGKLIKINETRPTRSNKPARVHVAVEELEFG